ncbi:MAG: hypothetical protein SFV54_03145 [Bryobacteraceae bacterium]|nr:hypothetical protein [Bryobacteraceae bacterium]
MPDASGTPAPPSASPASAGSSGLTENVASALCYLLGLFTGILFLVLAPYNQNRNIRFHAFQSIFMHLALIVIWFVISAIMPWSVMIVLSPLLSLASIGLWLFLMWKAYNSQKVVLPVIGDLAQKQA